MEKSETEVTMKLIEELSQIESNWFSFFFKSDKDLAYKFFTKGRRWACDFCIDNGKAIKGIPSKQTFCDYSPFLAYVDSDKECKMCKQVFKFAKEEQQFWYENLGFWVQSEAINCIRCRKNRRAEKEKIRNAQKRLSQILPTLDKTSETALREVINLYEFTNSTKKVKKYTQILKRVITYSPRP
jgi:hypothetical protein